MNNDPTPLLWLSYSAGPKHGWAKTLPQKENVMTNEKCDHPKFHENQLFESFIHKHILDPLHSDYARFLYYDNWPGAEDRDFISLDPINAGRITDLVSVFVTEHGENAG